MKWRESITTSSREKKSNTIIVIVVFFKTIWHLNLSKQLGIKSVISLMLALIYTQMLILHLLWCQPECFVPIKWKAYKDVWYFNRSWRPIRGHEEKKRKWLITTERNHLNTKWWWYWKTSTFSTCIPHLWYDGEKKLILYLPTAVILDNFINIEWSNPMSAPWQS